MTQFISIRIRLTTWYFLCLAAMLCIFGLGARFAMSASLQKAVDHNLQLRLADVDNFLKDEATESHAALLDELGEQAMLGLGGGNVELWSAGRLLFRTNRLKPGQFGGPPPAADSSDVRYEIRKGGREEYRVVSHSIQVNGWQYAIRVGEPMREFQEAIGHFDRLLLFAVPLLLLVASAGGYALSKRALAPVDRIARDAHSISIHNLAKRLDVPPANDELKRLALTLNAMLGRIEGAVARMVQFTGDASHELRTPLTLIQAAAEYSLRGERSRDELLEGLQRIRRESDRTARLLDDLLLLARTDEAQLQPVELGDVAQVAVDRIRTKAEVKQLSLSVESPREPVLVNGDEDALTRLFVILLDNAVKYGHQGGMATVSLSVQDGYAEAIVADNGPGIAADDLPKIWDRFWRADRVRSRDCGGAGLGLPIARAIADRHNAQIVVRSGSGEGTTFTIRIPTLPAEMAISPEQSR